MTIRFGIARKVFVILTGSTLLIGMGLTSWYVRSVREIALTEIRLRGAGMAHEFAESSAPGVETDNAFHSLEPMVESLSRQKDVGSVEIFNLEGRLLAGSRAPNGPGLGPSSRLLPDVRSLTGADGTRLLEFTEPVYPRGRIVSNLLEKSGEARAASAPIGVVRLALSLASLDTRIKRASEWAFGILGIALAAGAGLFYVFSRWLAGRVHALSHAVEEIGRGRYDVRIRSVWRDELGELAAGIRSMANELEHSRRETSLVQSATLGIAEADSVEKAFEIVIQCMCKATGWAYGEAWMLEDRLDHLEYRGSWHEKSASLEEMARAAVNLHCTKGEGLPGLAWSKAGPIWVSDVLGDATFVRAQVARRLGLHGAVAIPIMGGQQVIGVLVFFLPVATQREERTLNMLSAVAGQVGSLLMRKRAEEMVRTLSMVMAQVDDPVVIADRDGRFEYVNPAFERVTGWYGEEVIGLTPRILKSGFHPKHFYERMWETLLSGEVFRAEFVNVRKNGETYHNEQVVCPILSASGAVTGFVGAGRDVTERKHADRERIKADKLESVGVLAAGIAHDFNNILTAVIGNISFAKREAADGSELQSALDEAEKASRRAKALTQQLLTFSRGGAPVRRVIRPAELVRSSAEFASRGATVRCEVDCPDDVWSVEADPGQLQQVVQNLVMNAVQSMASGGTIRITLENATMSSDTPHPHLPPQGGKGDSNSPSPLTGLRPRRGEGKGGGGFGHLPLEPGRYVLLEVRDTGSGIASDHLSKVFDPYFTTKPTGSGLGLAVCHSIVKNHGGHIEIESEVGKGTTVRVYLPATERLPTSKARESAEPVKGKGRILVMDDEQAVRSVAVRMLKSLGYEVETANEGKEAADLYAARLGNGAVFDAVLMDLTVPGGMGGKEAVKEILKVDPAARVIVSSGYSADPILARFLDYGFKGRVPKPYGIEELSRTLAEVMGHGS